MKELLRFTNFLKCSLSFVLYFGWRSRYCSTFLCIFYDKTSTYNKSFISSACRLLNFLWVSITNECCGLSLPGFATVGIAFQLVHDAGSTQRDVRCFWLSWKLNPDLKLRMWVADFLVLTTSMFIYPCFNLMYKRM